MNTSKAKTTAGIRRAVWNETRTYTSSGLTKDELMISPSSGKIISIKKYDIGIKQWKKLKAEGLWAPPYSSN